VTGRNTRDQRFDIVLHSEAVVVRDLPLLPQVRSWLSGLACDFPVADKPTCALAGTSAPCA
jgi:hypothetical protein